MISLDDACYFKLNKTGKKYIAQCKYKIDETAYFKWHWNNKWMETSVKKKTLACKHFTAF